MIDAFVTHAPVIGLLFFFIVFSGIAIWALKPSNKKLLQSHGSIPLKEENNG